MPEPQTNLDPQEIAQFAVLADRWWDAEGPFRMLHRIGPVRLDFIRDAAARHFGLDPSVRRALAGLSCLDIGCGGGLVAEPLARIGGAVTAIDPAEENVAAARHHCDGAGLAIDYRATTAEELTQEGVTFDLVTCLEVIEHVPDQESFVATIASLVKPGGLLVLSTINRTPKSYALAIVGAEYVLGWLPRGTHDWTRFVMPDELDRYCRQAGLTGFKSEGVAYNPIADRWQRTTDIGVNYMAATARPA